jgi:DNA-binding SARP family transcriptional activator
MRATLFETFRLYAPNGDLIELGSPTTRSLLAYLLLNRQRPSDRRRLAFLFWPNASESAARRNLRQYIHHIRIALEKVDPQGAILLATGSTLQFNPQTPLWVDVEAFRHGTRPEASPAEIQASISLYAGDLLEDIYDEWCTAERDHLRDLYIQTLDRHSQALQAAGQVEEALKYAALWAEAEPYDENAHRRLMQLFALKGDRPRAIQVYQGFARKLEEELGAEPLKETQALLHSIQSGDSAPAALSAAGTRRPTKAPPTLAVTASAPRLVGREEELSALETLLETAKKGTGRLVLITGEAGIGKTRLLHEHLAKHPNAPILQSACYELDSMAPFSPMRQALETSPALQAALNMRQLPQGVMGQVGQLAPALAQSIPYLGSVTAALDAGEVRETWGNLLILLSRSFAGQPLQLILDDLHWADTPTWDLLASLARRATNAPLLIIGLCRLEDLSAERRALLRAIERSGLVTRIDLPRLNSQQTSDLALALTPDRASDPIFTQRLFRDTYGNPFFIIETVCAIQESGRQLQPAVDGYAVPISIQRVIEARFDHLSDPSREALTAAAAIGRAFSFGLLQEISQVSAEDCVKFIEDWLARGLVDESGQGYDFRHDQFRQVAYGSLSAARRQVLHGRIAAALEQTIPPADAATLAHHFARSDQPLKALPYLAQAGEQALRLRSYNEARQFGLQAVSLLGQMPGPRQRSERIDINLQLAQAYAFTGDLQHAIQLLDETDQLANALGDESRLGQIYRRSAQFFWLRGQPELAADYARRTLRVAEELNSNELLFSALRMLGRVSIALAAFDDAIAYLMRYVNLHEELTSSGHTSGLPDDLSIVLGYLGVSYTRVGAWERALACARRGLSLAEQKSVDGMLTSTIVFARMQLAMVYAGLFDWDNCLATIESIPDPLEFSDFTPALYMTLSLRGYALAHHDSPSTGAVHLQRAVDWASQSGYRVFHYLPRLFLAKSLLLDGQVDQAEKEAFQAMEEARKAGNRWAEGIGQQLMAEIGTRQPSPDWSQVEQQLIQSMQMLRAVRARPDLARTYLSLRRLYDRAGQMAWAVDCHFRATSIFEELGMLDELRKAQGQAGSGKRGAVVIPNLPLKGPNVG